MANLPFPASSANVPRHIWPDGQPVTNGTPITTLVPCGVGTSRVRIKTTGAGTLSAAFVRLDRATAYSANNPADVPVTGGTETQMNVDSRGEPWIRFTFTPSATGTITYADWSTGFTP